MFELHSAVSAISYHLKICDYFATKIFLFSKDDWTVLRVRLMISHILLKPRGT